MPNPYLTDEVATLTTSHKRAMAAMSDAAQQQGEQGVRAVELWQQLLALLTPGEATEAGQIVMQKSAEYWAEAKLWEAKGLDALALSLGSTRAALLDELATVPETFPPAV